MHRIRNSVIKTTLATVFIVVSAAAVYHKIRALLGCASNLDNLIVLSPPYPEKTETVTLTDTSERSDTGTPSATDQRTLADINGIGPATIARLATAGVHTCDQLYQADPDLLAEQSGLSAARIRNWQQQS